MIREPLKVLHVVSGTGHQGGVMSFVTRIAAEDQSGIRNLIWKHRDFKAPEGQGHYLCLGVARETDRNLRSDFVGAFQDLPPLVRWARKEERLILYAHSRLGIFTSVMATCLVPRPILIHLHALAGWPKFYRLLWRGAGARPIFNSTKTCRYFGEAPANSLIVMPPTSWPQFQASGQRLGEANRFVACGAFVRGKHFDILMRAFQKLCQENSTAELHIYGLSAHPPDPGCQDEIVALAQNTPKIYLHEWDVNWANFLCCDDVFVHLGRPESFGMVVLEAFARGCKLVLLEDTFLADLPPPLNRSGVYATDQLTPESIALHMKRSLLDPAPPGGRWEIRQRAAASFSIEGTRARLAQIYENAIGFA